MLRIFGYPVLNGPPNYFNQNFPTFSYTIALWLFVNDTFVEGTRTILFQEKNLRRIHTIGILTLGLPGVLYTYF